jgi:hypothetical protein
MCKGECGIGPFVIGVRPGKRRGGGWGCLMPDWDAKIGVCVWWKVFGEMLWKHILPFHKGYFVSTGSMWTNSIPRNMRLCTTLMVMASKIFYLITFNNVQCLLCHLRYWQPESSDSLKYGTHMWEVCSCWKQMFCICMTSHSVTDQNHIQKEI